MNITLTDGPVIPALMVIEKSLNLTTYKCTEAMVRQHSMLNLKSNPPKYPARWDGTESIFIFESAPQQVKLQRKGQLS